MRTGLVRTLSCGGADGAHALPDIVAGAQPRADAVPAGSDTHAHTHAPSSSATSLPTSCPTTRVADGGDRTHHQRSGGATDRRTRQLPR